MSKFSKLMGTTLGLIAITAAVPAFAQSSSAKMIDVNPVTMWKLSETQPKGAQAPLIYYASGTAQDVKITPWIKENTGSYTPINKALYTRFDPTEFDYTVSGPVKLSVGKSYQRLLTTNTLTRSDIIVTNAPIAGSFALENYEVATTATLGFGLKF